MTQCSCHKSIHSTTYSFVSLPEYLRFGRFKMIFGPSDQLLDFLILTFTVFLSDAQTPNDVSFKWYSLFYSYFLSDNLPLFVWLAQFQLQEVRSNWITFLFMIFLLFDICTPPLQPDVASDRLRPGSVFLIILQLIPHTFFPLKSDFIVDFQILP